MSNDNNTPEFPETADQVEEETVQFLTNATNYGISPEMVSYQNTEEGLIAIVYNEEGDVVSRWTITVAAEKVD